MAAFQIPEHIDNQLNELAAATGQSKGDLILQALTDRLGLEPGDRSLSLNDFTPAELERMKVSIEQLDRGKFVAGEEVSAKLKRWQTELSSRRAPSGSRRKQTSTSMRSTITSAEYLSAMRPASSAISTGQH
jgi:predicted transcriptional regulator